MKYCIGCKFLKYSEKQMSCGSSWTGQYTSEEASMSCAKGKWRSYLDEYSGLFDLEKAMEAAETCPEFDWRPQE